MLHKLTLRDLDLNHKKVLMRVDFNVPFKKDGSIADDTRIREAIPSIRYVLQHGGSLILMGHLGRPKGKFDAKASLAPCAKRLSELLGQPVEMASDCIGPSVEKLARSLKQGNVLLLENVRFHIGEEEPEKEPGFIESLARLGDVYVNDAFGSAHRAHASTALIARYFPGQSAMGQLIEKELSFLSPLLAHPKRPFHVIIGGAKASSKAGVIKNLLSRLDRLFIGGAMAFPFFQALGKSIGTSLCDAGDIPIAAGILKAAQDKIVLPSDTVAIKGKAIEIFSGDIPDGWAGMDIGPKTLENWKQHLQGSATIFWNGPLGVCEKPPFDQGTRGVAETLAALKANVIVGGGDSVAAIDQMGLAKRFSHLSTGGGASLEFLEFGHLPGVDALTDK